jgi:hypothetical protein
MARYGGGSCAETDSLVERPRCWRATAALRRGWAGAARLRERGVLKSFKQESAGPLCKCR